MMRFTTLAYFVSVKIWIIDDDPPLTTKRYNNNLTIMLKTVKNNVTVFKSQNALCFEKQDTRQLTESNVLLAK